MPPHHLLGPLIATYRASVSVLHVLLMASLGPLVIAVSVVAALQRELTWMLLLGTLPACW